MMCPKRNAYATYYIDGLQLQTVSEEKDLGLIKCEVGKCSAAVLNADRILDMIMDRSPGTIMVLYKV